MLRRKPFDYDYTPSVTLGWSLNPSIMLKDGTVYATRAAERRMHEKYYELAVLPNFWPIDPETGEKLRSATDKDQENAYKFSKSLKREEKYKARDAIWARRKEALKKLFNF